MAFATDDFSGVSGDIAGDSLSGGGTWAHNAHADFSDGVLQAQSGGVAQATNGVDCVYYASPDPSSADYEVQMSVAATVASSIDSRGLGVAGRISTSAASAYILYRDQTGLYLYKAVAGVYTLLGSYSVAAVNAATDTLTLRMVGTTITGYLNSVQRISVTDSTITSAGKAGIYAFSAYTVNLAQGWIGDSFDATDLAPVAKSASDTATATDTASAVQLSSLSASDAATATDAGSAAVLTETEFASDDFTLASGDLNGDALSGGGTWAKLIGSLFSGGSLVADSAAARSNVAVDSGYLASPTPSSADYVVELDVWAADVGSNLGTSGIGVIARGSSAGGDNGYVAYVDRTTIYLGRVVNGVWTTLASVGWTPSNGSVYTLALDVTGSALTVKLDGIVKLSTSDSTHAAAGSAGLYAFAKHSTTNASSWRGDNFTATAHVAITSSSVNASDAATATDAATGVAVVVAKSASDAVTATDSSGVLVPVGGRAWASGLSAWTRRREITVTGHRAPLSNYPVRVDLAYSSGMKTDFSDLRFTDANGAALTFWRDHYTSSTSAVFWVVMPATPTTSATDVVVAYYGNAAASYAGAAFGANGIFLGLDGGSAEAIDPAADYDLAVGAPGAWDDSYIFNSRYVRNLDGSLYQDGSGYAYLLYIGSNAANRATAGGVGDDRPGFYRTQDFLTFENLTPAAPAITWDAGTWHPLDGAYWNGRVVQPFAVIYDGTKFMLFTDGDRGPAHVVEDYTQGVYTAPAISGPWTQDAGNPTFLSGHAQVSGYNDSIAYGGDVIYDPDEPDSSKRWKTWYTGLNVNTLRWGVMYATAPAYNGPWTRHATSYVFQPHADGAHGGIYGGGVDRVFKLRGIYYMLWEQYGTPTWSTQLALSVDGVNWTNQGEVFAHGSGWDSARAYWAEVGYDPVADIWRLSYTGSDGGTVYSGGTDVPDLKIGSTSWAATRPPQADDPTTSVGAEQSTAGPTDTATATDSGSKSVTIGLATLSASDSASVSDSGSAYVPVPIAASDSLTATDTASVPTTYALATDAFAVAEEPTGVAITIPPTTTRTLTGLPPGATITLYRVGEWRGSLLVKRHAGQADPQQTATVNDYGEVVFADLAAGEYVATCDRPWRRIFFQTGVL